MDSSTVSNSAREHDFLLGFVFSKAMAMHDQKHPYSGTDHLMNSDDVESLLQSSSTDLLDLGEYPITESDLVLIARCIQRISDLIKSNTGEEEEIV